LRFSTAKMMHPARQAYVEEEDTDMGINFADLRESRGTFSSA
jgi:hypothetical protein